MNPGFHRVLSLLVLCSKLAEKVKDDEVGEDLSLPDVVVPKNREGKAGGVTD
tara:strand:- start:748 stop:903 length:156 start_codon:yes stop_codon:yes gene_type:complete